VTVNRLPHGYTNFTRRLPGELVEKTYDGPRRWENARRELACLTALATRLPVAEVVLQDLSVPQLTLTALPGVHGQDLIDRGHASRVLSLVGTTLASLQSLEVETVPGLVGDGRVVVHGDFGPQNMVFDLERNIVTGILDWESAHVGSPIEDLAWAEWIVRMHHPRAIDALDALFTGLRQRPPWSERQASMVEQSRRVLAYCELAGMTESAHVWREQLRNTEAWTHE
jgi:aminoglycoside phosphotransferase